MRIILIFLLFASARAMKIGCTMGRYTYATIFANSTWTCMVTSIDYSDDPTQVTSVTGTNLNAVELVDFGSINGNCQQLRLKVIPQGLQKFFPALKMLTFYNCSITSLNGGEFTTYTNLEVLDMTYVNLPNVPGNLFASNPCMKYAGFRNCNVKNCGHNLFSGLGKLQRLYFQNNLCINSFANSSSQCASFISLLRSQCPDVSSTTTTTTTLAPTTTTTTTPLTTTPTTTTTTTISTTTTVPPCATDTIPAGVTIVAPYTRTSCNGCFSLVFQTDGNLVIYQNPTGAVVWATYTQGKGVNRAVMQPDGNFVLYTASNTPVWYTGWTGSGTTVAKIGNDGQLIIMNGNNMVYSNGVTAQCATTTVTPVTSTTTTPTTTTAAPFDPNAYCANLDTGYYTYSVNSSCNSIIYCYTSNGKDVGVIEVACQDPTLITTTTVAPGTTSPKPPININYFCTGNPVGTYAIDGNSTCTGIIYCMSSGSGAYIIDCSSSPFDANAWCATMPAGTYPTPIVDGTCTSYVTCNGSTGQESMCASPALFNPATKACSSTFVCE